MELLKRSRSSARPEQTCAFISRVIDERAHRAPELAAHKLSSTVVFRWGCNPRWGRPERPPAVPWRVERGQGRKKEGVSCLSQVVSPQPGPAPCDRDSGQPRAVCRPGVVRGSTGVDSAALGPTGVHVAERGLPRVGSPVSPCVSCPCPPPHPRRRPLPVNQHGQPAGPRGRGGAGPRRGRARR